jgi:hypothetical protein
MRWSERRTAVRSHLRGLPHFYSERRAPSSAVAHLVLVRSMRALAVIVALTALVAVAGDERYYPPDVSSWAPQHLIAMKEPSLFAQEKATREEYRFLWLRTFDKPIAIRIWSDAPGAQMRVVRLSGAGGYDPGHIESDTTIKISPEDWKRFRDCIAKAQFWQMPTKQPLEEELGFDGSQWILEAREAAKYHVVDRWSPREGAYSDCCRLLVTLAKLQIPKDEFY